jgi:hypothetical protein
MHRPTLLVSMVLALAPLAVAAKPAPAAVEACEPWSRPAVGGGNGVGYMRLINRGRRPATLTRVESPLARRVEMHRSSMQNGVMSMSSEPRIDIPAGGTVAFAPGAYHLMFIGLKRGLKPGDRLPAILLFAGGRKLKVDFAVGSGLGPPAPAAGT